MPSRKGLTLIGVLGGAATLTGLWASGYPRRSGLTSAQALVSMPGDLVLPTARIQADRVVHLLGTSGEIWPLVEDLAAAYADLWNVPLRTVYDTENELLVLQTDEESVGEDPDLAYWNASLAIRLIPGTDGMTSVQIRERYLENGRGGAIAAYFSMTLSAVLVRRWARQSRRLLVPEQV